jgi:hypothetical protein
MLFALRSAALRDGSPPRHAKRASGTPGLRRKEEFFSAARVRRHKCLLHPVMVYIHAENTLDAEQGTDTCPHGGYEVAAVAEFRNGAANGVESHPYCPSSKSREVFQVIFCASRCIF